MSTLAAVFSNRTRPLFIPYIMAGDGDTLARLDDLVAAGADIIELGMPFSDPAADGVTIQEAGKRALKAGMTVAGALDIVRQFSSKNKEIPIVLMGYYNPVLQYGEERFTRAARQAGAAGALIVDVPPEEDTTLAAACAAGGIDLVRLLAPTTPPERVRFIAGRASGYLYYVAVAGVTGTQAITIDTVRDKIKVLRQQTALPLAVGFGITKAAEAAAIAAVADAVVVGSALVKAAQDSPAAFKKLATELAEAIHGAGA